MNKYYDMLNESFNKYLLEAQQVVIDFKNIFGDELYQRFQAQKQRLSSPQNDISFWVKRYKEIGIEDATEELDDVLSAWEEKKTRSEKRREAEEGADLIYEDDIWLVYHIKTYEAAAKYGAHTRWCITGRYDGSEDDGQYFFNNYLQYTYDGYYFFIRKDNPEEKYAVCPRKSGGYSIWDPTDNDGPDGDLDFVPNGPTEPIPELPNLPVEEANWHYSYAEYKKDEEDELDDEDDGEDELPEWEDPQGNVHRGQRPPMPESQVLTPVEYPESMEFQAESKEEAARKFREGAEIVGTIREPDLFIVKYQVEPHGEFEVASQYTDEETGEILENPYYVEDDGTRYTMFVFIPGQGGGPLLAQIPSGFALVEFRDLEQLQNTMGNQMQNIEIRNNEEQQEESLKENFYSYKYEEPKEKGPWDEKVEECIKEDVEEEQKEESPCSWNIMVNGEPIMDNDEKIMEFSSDEEAKNYARDELELLDGDYDIVQTC